jgi:hypothetical protein
MKAILIARVSTEESDFVKTSTDRQKKVDNSLLAQIARLEK